MLDIAKRGEVQDTALWFPTVTATGARGASTALVGTPQVVADAILAYTKLGADLISIRGYGGSFRCSSLGFLSPRTNLSLLGV